MKNKKATIPLLRRLIKAHTEHRPKKDTKKAVLLHMIRNHKIIGEGTSCNPYKLQYLPHVYNRYAYGYA